MAKPNLAYIPATIGNKVYSILPNDSVGDFDFTRGSEATRINAQGLIETVASGENRLNYSLLDGEVVGCPHLLLEDEATNSIPYSEDATNWSTLNSSVLATSNQVISPDGTLNADKLIPASGSVTSNGGRYINFSSTASTDYSVSVFVKQGEYRYVTFSYGGQFAYGFHFDLQDGVIIQELSNAQYTSISREVESFANGWYRLKISLTDTVSQAARFISVRPANELPTAINNNYATTGDGTSGIYVWGLQIEEGSYATSYIKSNSGSATTRVAETCDGSGNAATFNDSEGVLMAEIAALADDGAFRVISLDGGDNTNIVKFGYRTTSNAIYYEVRSGDVSQAFQIYTTTDVKEFHKVAVLYQQNNFKLFINGVNVLSDTSGVTPVGLNNLSFGIGASANFYGNTKQIQYFDSTLTDTELEQLTSWDSFRAMAEGQLYTIE